MADQPNQGATGDVPPEQVTEVRPQGDAPSAQGSVNQGATGDSAAATGATGAGDAVAARRMGETPLSVDAQGDAFDERPELFVAGAFLGGVVLAQVLRRFGS